MSNTNYCGYQEWKNWSQGEFGICRREDALYYASEFVKCGLLDLSGIRVLEIGFGNGSFAGWATEMGAEYYGVETISELVSLSRTRGFSTYASETPLSEITEVASVDLVVAFDVFEHLEIDLLISTLKDIHERMRKDSVLLFRVPSGDSPFSRAIQYGDLTHSVVLGSSAAYQLAVRAGFEVISIRPPAFPLWGLGVLSFFRRAMVAGARCIIYPIVTHLLMGSGKPVLSPNMVCIFRKP